MLYWIVRWWIVNLALLRDWTIIILVTHLIVERRHGQQLSSPISPGAQSVPDSVNAEKGIVGKRIFDSIDGDVPWSKLTLLVVRLGDVTVLLIAQQNLAV